MAHFRLGALAILKTLDGQIIRAIFGMADEQKIDTNTLLYALMSNPWYDPAQPNTEKQIKIVRRVGAFRGFGGTFLEPPRIAWTNIGFVAGDNADHWLLMADAFGATLHATEKADSVSISSPFKLERGGRIKNGEASATFPELADVTSYAASQNTLAVTTDLTHAIYLIAFS
jgi:hypothetical protein